MLLPMLPRRAERRVTEDSHQKPHRSRGVRKVCGMLLELFMCLHRVTEVFLLGAGTQGSPARSVTPLVLSRESLSGRRLMAFKCLMRARTGKILGQVLSSECLKESFTRSGSSY